MLRRVVVSSLLALLLGAAPAGATPLVRADADTALRGPRLPRSFIGVSQEYRLIELFTGNPSLGYNTATGGMLHALRRFGDGPPVLRVGGVSSDDTWWNPAGAPRPPGLNQDMSPRMLDGLRTFAERAGVKLLLGLNLAYGDPQVPVAEAQAIVDAIPSRLLEGLEIGNEPDFYARRPLYRTREGTTVYARDAHYGPADYRGELRRTADQLARVVGDVLLAGPSTSPQQDWVRALPSILRRGGERLGLVTMHTYPLNACHADKPTVAKLLADDSIRRSAVALTPAVAAAAKRGLGMRITESNSVACGGKAGVSNALAASLWTVDHLFAMWLIGAKGVDFHASSPLYQPFGSFFDGAAFHGSASAPYYGMLAFAEATQRRARMLPSVVFGAQPRKAANVHVWGTLSGKTIRVLVLNKDLRRGGSAVIRVRGAGGAGRVVRLGGPSASATSGITWGGQTVPAGSDDGALEGNRVTQHVRRREGDRFVFDVPKASAALLTVKVRRLRHR